MGTTKQKAMTNNYGIIIGRTLTTYTNVNTLEQMVPAYLRKIIEMEGKKIPAGGLVDAVQNYVNEYGESVVENQMLDYGEVNPGTVVSIMDAASHLADMGWITINKNSIDNMKQYRMIYDWMKRKGIKDFEA